MYDLLAYGTMMADRGRAAAYARALELVVKPDDVVLDVGTGPGIMALLACRAGAARVFAVEPSGIIDVAREVAAANGCADRITFVQAMSTDIDLQERVDGIVAEIHGVLPLYQRSLASLIDARERFLKPGGWMVPARETLWAALVSSPRAHASIVGGWSGAFGFDFRAAAARAVNQVRRDRFTAAEIVSGGECWGALDYASLPSPSVRGTATLRAVRAAAIHGLAVWFDAETGLGAGFSNSPLGEERHIFGQLFMPWPEPLALGAGSTVDLELRADFTGEEYVLTWTSDVDGGSPSCRRRFRQSSVFAELLGAAELRKRSPEHVPAVGSEAHADRRVIELLERGVRLGDIAEDVGRAFPQLFPDWNAAMARVGSLSARYGR